MTIFIQLFSLTRFYYYFFKQALSLDSKRYARFQIEKIQNKIEILKNGNIVGKKVSEIDDENIREIFEGKYRIIYRIVSINEIHILLIHHGAKDLVRIKK